MNSRSETEIAVLREIAAVMARERNVRSLLETAIDIFERRLGMLRGTFTLLDGDELRIAASASELNAEGRSLGRYLLLAAAIMTASWAITKGVAAAMPGVLVTPIKAVVDLLLFFASYAAQRAFVFAPARR